MVGRGALGLVYVYSHFPLLAGVAAFGEGTKLAIAQAGQPSLAAGTRWALAGGIAAFALSLAALHIGAEWTSVRDRSFVGRIVLGALALTLAVAGGRIPPAWFVAVVAAAVLAQLLLEAFTVRAGAASTVDPRRTDRYDVTAPPNPTSSTTNLSSALTANEVLSGWRS